MKILLTGDWHITAKRPENRIDDYYQAIKRKITFIFETAKENDIITILQAGDMTDSPIMSWATFIDLYELFGQYPEIDIYTIFGQHDLKFRNTGSTALNSLATVCKNIHLLSNGILPLNLVGKDTFAYGSSYGENVPEITTDGFFNILITHRMMIQDKLWEGQEEYTQAGSFLRANAFNVILSGDNHQGFIVDSKLQKKHLFNPGSLMRSKVDQLEHEPFIIIFDTDTSTYEKIMVPIEPADKVFNIEKVVKEKAKDQNLEAYVSGMLESKEIGLKLEDNLNTFMDKNQTEQSVREILEWSKTGEVR